MKQSTRGKRRYQLRFFSTFSKNNLVNFDPLTKKWPWLFTHNLEIKWGSCKISSSWVQRFMSCHDNKILPYLSITKNPKKIRSCDLNLWPMTLKFSGFHAVVKEHVHAKISSSTALMQWLLLVSYLAYRGKKSAENNTVRRYREISKNEHNLKIRQK